MVSWQRRVNVGSFLIWLSGANRYILKNTRGEVLKFEGLGGVVLTTAVIAAISAAIAINLALQVTIILCIPIGLLWGIAIMNLDRWLIGAFPRRDRFWKNFLQALPRFLMALIIGVVVSTPLVLRLFDNEINKQIEVAQQVEQDAQEKKITDQYRVSDWQDRVDLDRQRILAKGNQDKVVQSDKAVAGAWKALSATRTELEEAKSAGGSQDRIGELTARERAQTQNYNRAVTNAVERLNAQGKKDLPADQAQLDRAIDLRKAALDEFHSSSEASRGLLDRVRALGVLRANDDDVNTTYLVLWAFITLIEILPVLLKLLLTIGPKNAYDEALEQYTADEINRVKRRILHDSNAEQQSMEADADLRQSRIKAKAEYDKEQLRRKLERASHRTGGSNLFGP